MNCDNYTNLLPKERIDMIGKLIHATQSSNEIFNRAKVLIKQAEKMGLFEGVTINPPPVAPELPNDKNDQP